MDSRMSWSSTSRSRRRAAASREEDQKSYTALQGLGRVNMELVRRIVKPLDYKTATLDRDATIQERHKRAAPAHDKGRCSRG